MFLLTRRVYLDTDISRRRYSPRDGGGVFGHSLGAMMGEPLATRRDVLTLEVLPLLADPVWEAPRFDAALADLIAAVRGDLRESSLSASIVSTSLASARGRGARCGSTARRSS